MKKRQWTLEEKRQAVERMKSCGHDKLAKEWKVERRQLYRWRAQLKGVDSGLSQEWGSKKDLRRENRQMKELVATQALEIQFFKGALRKIEARRRQNSVSGGTAFTNRYE